MAIDHAEGHSAIWERVLSLGASPKEKKDAMTGAFLCCQSDPENAARPSPTYSTRSLHSNRSHQTHCLSRNLQRTDMLLRKICLFMLLLFLCGLYW